MQKPLKGKMTFKDRTLFLEGALVQQTVMELWKNVSTIFNRDPFVVDCQQVQICDSAGIAFLLEIVRAARQQKTPIHFSPFPEGMLKLIKVNGIVDFLPLEPHSSSP